MAPAQREIKRVKSGIEGLDVLLRGGFPENSTILLSGTPGTGKTIFSIQFLVNGAMKHGENGVYVSLEEDVERLAEYMSIIFNWPIKELVKQKKLLLVRSDIYDFNKFKDLIETHVEKLNAKRLVIDPITVLGLFFERPLEIRRSLLDLDRLLKKLECTTILTCEIPEGENAISSFKIEEFTCDGIIILSYYSGEFPRGLVIRKMRATEHDTDVFPFEIKSGVGIVVHSKEKKAAR